MWRLVVRFFYENGRHLFTCKPRQKHEKHFAINQFARRICRWGECHGVQASLTPCPSPPQQPVGPIAGKEKTSKNKVSLAVEHLSSSNNVFRAWFLLFLLLWDERPAGIYAVMTNQRPSLAWDFGLAWWQKALKELIPQECFFMFLSMEIFFWRR